MWYRISVTIFEILIRILFRLRIFGRENFPDAPYIVTSNHASFLDPPLVAIACRRNPVSFMGKKELFEVPGVRIWARLVGIIRTDRDAKSISALREAIRQAKKGRVIGIFPEGSRAEDGRLREAKRGVGFLIAMCGVPVVPIYIEGSGYAMKKDGKICRGAPLGVFVGRPMMPEEFVSPSGEKRTDYEGISNMVMERIAEIKEKKDELSRAD